MKPYNILKLLFTFLTILSIASCKTNKETNLLDKQLSKWEVWIGVPHTSINLEGVQKYNDVREGTPLGLNNDPKKVFSIIEENGETLLKITGEIYGGLTTKEEYGNYHFKTEFKWGQQKWAPRLRHKRDSGILYHAKGPHGAFWNTWMSCLEFQVQEGDCGDFFPLGTLNGDVSVSEMIDKKGKTRKIYTPGVKAIPVKHAKKSSLHEKPNGEWNVLEIYCLGNESIHLVNGHVVNRIKNATEEINGEMIPAINGKIQIQSEAAEIYYKNMHITSITEFPKEFKKL